MKKSDILAQLGTVGLTQDVLETLQAELNTYPEEMTQEDAKRFDSFLQAMQMSEIDEAQHITKLADFMEQAGEEMDQNLEDFTYNSLKAMKTSLSDAQDLANMAE